jgi:hypothetical protein
MRILVFGLLCSGCGFLPSQAPSGPEAVHLACVAFAAAPRGDVPVNTRHEILEACAMVQAAVQAQKEFSREE